MRLSFLAIPLLCLSACGEDTPCAVSSDALKAAASLGASQWECFDFDHTTQPEFSFSLKTNGESCAGVFDSSGTPTYLACHLAWIAPECGSINIATAAPGGNGLNGFRLSGIVFNSADQFRLTLGTYNDGALDGAETTGICNWR
jgi:hypothetical protein